MAIAMRASATAASPAVANRLSASNGGRITITVTDVDLSAVAVWLAIGAAGGDPATYADWDGDQGGNLPVPLAGTSVKYKVATELSDVTVSIEFGGGQFSIGDDLYVGMFNSSGAAPSPTDEPLLVAGPFPVAA